MSAHTAQDEDGVTPADRSRAEEPAHTWPGTGPSGNSGGFYLGMDFEAIEGADGEEELEDFHDAADHFPYVHETEDDEGIEGENEEEDEDYEDVENDDEEDEEDEEEGESETDDFDNDDELEDQTVAYFTRGQLNAMLQNDTLHQVLLGVTGWDPADDSEPESFRRDPRGRPEQTRSSDRWPEIPSKNGQKLMDSGIFGAVEWQHADNLAESDLSTDRHTTHIKIAARRRPVPLRLLDRETGFSDTMADRGLNEKMIAQSLVPSTAADMVLRYDGPVYLGQFSDDGNFFFSGTKDLHLRMYDTSNINEWHHYKTVTHPTGRWTMTDASLSPDNRWLAFTSMMPQVCLAPTDPNDTGDPYLLDLSRNSGVGGLNDYVDSFCIFSVRFSGDGRELVAGTNANSIVVYDIESRAVLHHLVGHENDVNAVCFGDKTSPHLLYSGSDDATIKVWDRRSLRDNRPAGAFVGHCEGITYIDSKGDGRYILSNGKDQTMRLWDLRKAMSTANFELQDPTRYTRSSRYDYRFQRYVDDLYFRHPNDNSVVTFRGHRVERTLLRCHFSPPGSSDSRYVYSASHSGKVYIWNLDATLASVIDVREATGQTLTAVATEEERRRLNELGRTSEEETLPLPPSRERPTGRRRQRDRRVPRVFNDPLCVRDASWHPTAPIIVASCFDAEDVDNGFCSVHSCDLTQDGDVGGKPHRLFDERMRVMTSVPPRRPMLRWWA